MPHLEIEYSAHLSGLDPEATLLAAVSALETLGEYDMASTKARIRAAEVSSVSLPDTGAGFVAVTIGILPGRSEEMKLQTSQALTDAVAATVPAGSNTQVSTQVRELLGYTKRAV